ncbi:MAG: PilW family protein [Solirubrobacterales bacterium]
MSPANLVSDQRGFTLVEQLLATAAALVVLFGLTTVIMTTLHQSARVNGRVDATQRARIALYRVIDSLHSSCVAPQIAPVQAGSTGTSLRFLHQTGSDVAPTPVLSQIDLNNGTLTESVFSATGGSVPSWTFASTPSMTRQLITGVSTTTPFRYYSYNSGQVSATPLPSSPLQPADAARTVQVTVALKVSPSYPETPDPRAAASIQDTALLRFSPAAFSTSANNLPCQ